MQKFFTFFFFLWAFQCFCMEMDCRDLPKSLYIKRVRTLPESEINFELNINGFEWAKCAPTYMAYTVTGKDLGTSKFKSGTLSFDIIKDWLEFQPTSYGRNGYSLYVHGMNGPDGRIWHNWNLLFDEGPKGKLVHHAVIPAARLKPGESYEVFTKEFEVIVER